MLQGADVKKPSDLKKYINVRNNVNRSQATLAVNIWPAGDVRDMKDGSWVWRSCSVVLAAVL